MPLSPELVIIDMRPERLRQVDDLAKYTRRKIIALSLDLIENGSHGLSGSMQVLVVCEQGSRSALAARYLQSDGVDAVHWPLGWAELISALRL